VTHDTSAVPGCGEKLCNLFFVWAALVGFKHVSIGHQYHFPQGSKPGHSRQQAWTGDDGSDASIQTEAD